MLERLMFAQLMHHTQQSSLQRVRCRYYRLSIEACVRQFFDSQREHSIDRLTSRACLTCVFRWKTPIETAKFIKLQFSGEMCSLAR